MGAYDERNRAGVNLAEQLGPPAQDFAHARGAKIWCAWLRSLSVQRLSAPAPRTADALVAPEELSALSPPLELGDPVAWQKLWLSTQRRPWRTLAVIPVEDGVATPRIATALAQVGVCQFRSTMRAVDATARVLSGLHTGAWMDTRDRVVLALGSVLSNPASLWVAQTVDAAILCVSLEKTAISMAMRTIEEVGEDRFLGTVLLERGSSR